MTRRFKVQSTDARPQRWDDANCLMLVADVEVVKREHPKFGDARACGIVIDRYPSRYGRDSAKSLNNRLVEARTNKMLAAHILKRSHGPVREAALDIIVAAFAADQEAAAEAEARVAAFTAKTAKNS